MQRSNMPSAALKQVQLAIACSSVAQGIHMLTHHADKRALARRTITNHERRSIMITTAWAMVDRRRILNNLSQVTTDVLRHV